MKKERREGEIGEEKRKGDRLIDALREREREREEY